MIQQKKYKLILQSYYQEIKMNKFLTTLLITLSLPIFAADETASIRNSLKESIPQLRYCFHQLIANSNTPTELQGAINLKFTLGTDGRASNIIVTSNEFSSDKIFDCMKNVLEGVQFVIPADGRTLRINQPMKLYPIRN